MDIYSLVKLVSAVIWGTLCKYLFITFPLKGWPTHKLDQTRYSYVVHVSDHYKTVFSKKII